MNSAFFILLALVASISVKQISGQDEDTVQLRRTINTKFASQPKGPYVQAQVIDKTIYIVGCFGFAPNGELVTGGAVAEARQALFNLKEILKEAGATLNNVAKVIMILANMDDLLAVNDVYSEFFVENKPPRNVFQAGLPMGTRVTFEVTAVTGKVIDV